jgi:hypothetical protein
MIVRPLLLDEMYPAVIAQQLRKAVVETPELLSAPDDQVLAAATASNRCLVTENVKDFAVLAQQVNHAGLLYVNARRWPRTQSGIYRIISALEDVLSAMRVPGSNEISWL